MYKCSWQIVDNAVAENNFQIWCTTSITWKFKWGKIQLTVEWSILLLWFFWRALGDCCRKMETVHKPWWTGPPPGPTCHWVSLDMACLLDHTSQRIHVKTLTFFSTFYLLCHLLDMQVNYKVHKLHQLCNFNLSFRRTGHEQKRQEDEQKT